VRCYQFQPLFWPSFNLIWIIVSSTSLPLDLHDFSQSDKRAEGPIQVELTELSFMGGSSAQTLEAGIDQSLL
jgi:hypothetical protein